MTKRCLSCGRRLWWRRSKKLRAGFESLNQRGEKWVFKEMIGVVEALETTLVQV